MYSLRSKTGDAALDKKTLQSADLAESLGSVPDWEEEYSTGAQAQLSFTEFPEPSPIKAATARVTAGPTPIPIYNCHRPAPGGRGGEGGAPFDDMAKGRHLARLQMVIPRRRFRLIRAAFPPASDVGDAILKYGRGDGYRLTSGVVGQGPAEEITVRSGIYSVFMLHFERARPLSSRPETPELEEPDLLPFSWRGYDLRFETESGMGWVDSRSDEISDAELTGELRASEDHTASAPDPTDWAQSQPFLYPLVEIDRPEGGGVLFQWSSGGYEQILDSSSGRPSSQFKSDLQ